MFTLSCFPLIVLQEKRIGGVHGLRLIKDSYFVFHKKLPTSLITTSQRFKRDVSFSLSGQDNALVLMVTMIMTTMTMMTPIMMMKIVIERGSFFACGVDFTLDQSPRTKTSTHIVMVGIQRYKEIHKFT